MKKLGNSCAKQIFITLIQQVSCDHTLRFDLVKMRQKGYYTIANRLPRWMNEARFVLNQKCEHKYMARKVAQNH